MMQGNQAGIWRSGRDGGARFGTIVAAAALAAVVLVIAGCGGSSIFAGPGSTVTYLTHGVMPQGIGIDAKGNVWIANQASDNVTELSPSGVFLMNVSLNSGSAPHGIKINRAPNEPTSGQIWVEDSGTGKVTVLNSSGVVIATCLTGLAAAAPQHAVFDSSGNAWVTNQGAGNVVEISYPTCNILQTINVSGSPHAISIDHNGNFWVGDYSSSGVLTEFNAADTLRRTVSFGESLTGNAIDPSGNLWQALSISGAVAEVDTSNANVVGRFSVNNTPRGVTIDSAGNGNVFVANQGSDTVTELKPGGGVAKVYAVGSQPENMAIDQHGNVWVTNAGSNSVTVLKGAAQPDLATDDGSNG